MKRTVRIAGVDVRVTTTGCNWVLAGGSRWVYRFGVLSGLFPPLNREKPLMIQVEDAPALTAALVVYSFGAEAAFLALARINGIAVPDTVNLAPDAVIPPEFASWFADTEEN